MKKIILSVFVLLTTSLFALEPVILSEEKGEYPLGLYLEILEDADGKLTIEDVQKPEMENLWVRSNKDVPSFGFTKSAYWARFKIVPIYTDKYFIEVAHPILDRIDLYQVGNRRLVTHKIVGDKLSYKVRDIDYRNFIFKVFANYNEDNVYYLRIESESSIQIPLTFWTPVRFAERKNTEMYVMGLFFGIMLVMGLYNLFIWITIRDNSYIYYVLFIFSSAFFYAYMNGIGFQYLWIGSSEIYNVIFPLTILTTVFFSIKFTLTFLQIFNRAPILNRIFKLILFIIVIVSTLSFFINQSIGTRISIFIGLISSILMLFSGIYIFRKGYRPAVYYMFAWATYLVGVIVLSFTTLGLIPKNFFTQYSMQIGSTLEVILLSLGLADRINDLKKQNEIEQLKTLEAEQKSSKIKDDFLSNLSHELKTPLSVVYAYSEMLTDNQDNPDKVRKYSSKIFDNAKTLNNYLSDLILISDLESDLQLQIKSSDIQSIIIQAVDEYIPLIKERNIQLEMKIKEKIEVNCDPILLTKAISAIIKNAIVYNKQDGRIEISIGKGSLRLRSGSESQGIQIQITDTGIGIAKEFHEKVFEKFFRLDSSLTYEVSGVGVGLYIAKKIVELHKGSIQLKNKDELGVEVTLELPLT